MFSGSADGILGQSSRRMEAIGVANFANELRSNDHSAAARGRDGPAMVFHRGFQFFLNLLNLISQIKEAAHRPLSSLRQDCVCIFWRASHQIPQSFLGKWVFELCAVAGVMHAMQENVHLVLEPRSFFDQPFPFQRQCPYLLGFLASSVNLQAGGVSILWIMTSATPCASRESDFSGCVILERR